MRTLIALPDTLFALLEPSTTAILATLARFIFAAVLLMYFWNSGLTKIPDGVGSLVSPSFNAFAQIFPKGAEAAGYDITQATSFQKTIVLLGTWAEFILPLLIVVGLYTRAAAFGMIVFILVQSATDIFGHGAELGRWFDPASDAVILDQRALWLFLLIFLVFRGAGPLSLDRYLFGPREQGYDPELQG
ncbi:MAG: DoxX family protein [Pseudomonadota bacterium]